MGKEAKSYYIRAQGDTLGIVANDEPIYHSRQEDRLSVMHVALISQLGFHSVLTINLFPPLCIQGAMQTSKEWADKKSVAFFFF